MTKRDQITKITSKIFDQIDSDFYARDLDFILDYIQYILYAEYSSTDQIIDQICSHIEDMPMVNK